MPNERKPVDHATQVKKKLEDNRALPRMLMGGTKRFRAEAAKWMPPQHEEHTRLHPGEKMSDWDARVSRAVIHPWFADAVQRGAATVLSEPVQFRDMPPEVLEWWESIDGENHGDVFFYRVLLEALADAGKTFILADMAPVPEGATMADTAAGGLRPYLVHIRPRDVLNEPLPMVEVNGRSIVERIRYREDRLDVDPDDPHGDPKLTERVRIIRLPEDGEEWVMSEVHVKQGKEWVQEGEPMPMRPHKEIPLWTLYVNRVDGGDDDIDCESPYMELANLNLEHTRSEADIMDSMATSLASHFVMTGWGGKEAPRLISGRTAIHTTNPQARATFMERTGTAIKVALERMDRIEKRLQSLSKEPLMRITGSDTATGRRISHSEAKIQAQVWALATSDAIEACLRNMGKYQGITVDGSAIVRPPEPVTDIDVEGLRSLLEMRRDTGGYPSIKTLLQIAQRIRLLPDDLDADEEIAQASRELRDLAQSLGAEDDLPVGGDLPAVEDETLPI